MKELYRSKRWLSTDPLDRAQLLLVLEGVKSGTIISVDHNLLDIVKEKGLAYTYNTDKKIVFPVVKVGTTTAVQKYSRNILLPTQKESFHTINGEFLGYPTCCIKEYISPRTPKQKEAHKKEIFHRTYSFGEQLEKMIHNTGTYPDFFEFLPPSFTPCSISCNSATEMLQKYQHILKIHDPIAANELREFNRRSNKQIYETALPTQTSSSSRPLITA